MGEGRTPEIQGVSVLTESHFSFQYNSSSFLFSLEENIKRCFFNLPVTNIQTRNCRVNHCLIIYKRILECIILSVYLRI